MSDVSTSTTSAKPRAWAMTNALSGAFEPLLMLPSNRKTGSVSTNASMYAAATITRAVVVSSRPVGNDSTSCTTRTRYSGPT